MASLKAHIATKAPKAPVFNLPHETNLARMLRDDLAEARKQWLSKAKGDPQEYSQRQQSDFLTDTSHEGARIDFHSLRHTCGAWVAMTGAHPKVVQQVMRHQSITLTMDTYGHLFPGQEADAIGQMRQMLIDHQSTPEGLRATGTDNHTARGALQLAQQLERETRRAAAKGKAKAPRKRNRPSPYKLRTWAIICDAMRRIAKVAAKGFEPLTRGL